MVLAILSIVGAYIFFVVFLRTVFALPTAPKPIAPACDNRDLASLRAWLLKVNR